MPFGLYMLELGLREWEVRAQGRRNKSQLVLASSFCTRVVGSFRMCIVQKKLSGDVLVVNSTGSDPAGLLVPHRGLPLNFLAPSSWVPSVLRLS